MTAAEQLPHPCQYSPEVLAVIEGLVMSGDHVYDPFAGTGLRLGALCDRVGATFAGGDIEDWAGKDRRVQVANALDPSAYPMDHPNADIVWKVVTSPVYQNKRCGDYVNGPTPNTIRAKRRDYGIALGAPLHPENLARYTGRPNKAAAYWELHADVAKNWPRRVIVNVDEAIGIRWAVLLEDVGYRIADVRPVVTRGYRGLPNDRKGKSREVVIVAGRTP